MDGEIIAGNDGIRTISTNPDRSIATKGSILGERRGISASASNGVVIDIEANVSGITSVAIFAESETGPIFIKNRGDLDSSGNSALWANSNIGDITIYSPEDGFGYAPVRIAATDDGIQATTAGSIDISFNGEINVISSVSAFGIKAESSGGPVTIRSNGSLSGISTRSAGGIWAKGAGDVLAKHEGSMSVGGSGVLAESTDGDVTVDTRETFISADGGSGLVALAPNGKVTVFHSGELAIGASRGIVATAGGEITIESSGLIQIIGGSSGNSPAPGISTESTGGSTSITHTGEISTTHSRQSPGITATAATDLAIINRGDISTLRGSGIIGNSTSGNVDIQYEGRISVTNVGGGIHASAPLGSINIERNDPDSVVTGSGDFTSSTAIHAAAGQSVTISWAGDISSVGNQASALFASSENAGVNVITKGDVSANGISSSGIVLSGPSILTANILGGSVSGANGASTSAGLKFIGGTENRVNNYGSISSLSFVAIDTGDGNETIDNHGQISGSIDLGEGTNVFENRSGAWLVTHNDLIIGAGNSLNNSGHLQIGEFGEEVPTTTMIGDLVMEASSSYHMEIEDTTIEGEPIIGKLVVNGAASIDGEIIIRMQEMYDEPKAGDAFTIVEADSLTGSFFSIRVLNGSNASAEVSRKVKVDLSYPGASVVGTVGLLDFGSYSDWKPAFFNESDSANDDVSGLGRDPDGDGYNNLAEYALGGSPGSIDTDLVKYDVGESGSTGINTLSTEETSAEGDSEVSISFNWANDVTDADWALERSSDLIGWEPVAPSEIEMVAGDEYTRITATTPIPSDVDGRLFVRVNVVELP